MSIIYDNAKPVTLKAVRNLYPGCLLETYFNDTETPFRYIVVERPDPHASHWDIRVIPEDAWLNPKAKKAKIDTLNTDRWTLLGAVCDRTVSSR